MLETSSSLFLVSTKRLVGFFRPVCDPLSTRAGVTSPLSVSRKTRIESPASLATYNSPRSRSRKMCAGQFNCVLAPAIVRIGAVSPVAFIGYTVIEGGSNRPPFVVGLLALPLITDDAGHTDHCERIDVGREHAVQFVHQEVAGHQDLEKRPPIPQIHRGIDVEP